MPAEQAVKEESMAQKSFVMYESWSRFVHALPTEKAGELMQAITGVQLGMPYYFTDETLRIYFESVILPELDKNSKKYQEICEARAEAGQRGGKAKAESQKQNVAEDSKEKQKLASASKDKQNVAKLADTESDTDTESDKDKEKESEERGGDAAPPTHTRRKQEPKHRYGAYGRVMLTQAQYDRFRDRHGQETTDAAIKILDEYCQSSGKRYADYNLTLYKWPLEEALKRGGEKIEREPERGAGADSSESPDAWTAEQLEQYRRAYEQSAVS